jgi:glycosyltransferase involved in cell wall biosynthesis
MRVAFISTDATKRGTTVEPGGAAYYRTVLPADGLREFGGIDAHWFPEARSLPNGEIAGRHDQWGKTFDGFDVVVLQRWMHQDIPRKIMDARATGQIIVQDIDDHMWAIHSANKAAKQVTSRTDINLDHYTRSIRAASHITVSTPFLAKVITDLGQPNVTVIRNAIDLRNWQRQEVSDQVKHIGWVGSTDHRSNDLEQLGKSLKYFIRKHPDIRFIHGGHRTGTTPAAKLLNIPNGTATVRGGTTIRDYPQLWQGIDIALCPLNPIDFNRSKSAIKAMEASAAGVPFIATDLDAYREYGCGMLVSAETEWTQALERLTDRTERQTQADRAHERVQQEDIARRWTDWADLFSDLTNERTAA